MDVSRRKLFGIGAAFAAAAAVPEIADAKPAEEAVGPMMFEHTCDRGKSRLDAEQLKDHDKYWKSVSGGSEYVWGCGTTFRWWFGCPSICPNCGWHYLQSLEDVKTGFYKRIQ